MIGMYAHHSGSGHVHRAREIARHLDDDVVVFSSRAGADVLLPLDLPDSGEPTHETAHDTLHYAPINSSGLTQRMALLAAWVQENQPRAFYVDVSVEVALFIRLLGIPVVTLAMPGDRPDTPHQRGYAQADAIIAAWPDWVPTPRHLQTHTQRLHPVGGISRLRPQPGVTRGHSIVRMAGAGTTDWEHFAFPPGVLLGGEHHVDDPTPYLQSARAVIAAAGQNSVADLAALRTPAIFIPQQRPFGEQDATAAVLEEAGLGVVVRTPPESWDELIHAAVTRAPQWHRWHTNGAAARAAHVIESVAR